MIALDASALVAILLGEPEAETFARTIATTRETYICAATTVEAGIVVETRIGPLGGRELDLLLAEAGTTVLALTPARAELARHAHRLYGKGRHPAGLNLGDCFAYALARSLAIPLLFKGDDFARTDVTPARLV